MSYKIHMKNQKKQFKTANKSFDNGIIKFTAIIKLSIKNKINVPKEELDWVTDHIGGIKHSLNYRRGCAEKDLIRYGQSVEYYKKRFEGEDLTNMIKKAPIKRQGATKFLEDSKIELEELNIFEKQFKKSKDIIR